MSFIILIWLGALVITPRVLYVTKPALFHTFEVSLPFLGYFGICLEDCQQISVFYIIVQ